MMNNKFFAKWLFFLLAASFSPLLAQKNIVLEEFRTANMKLVFPDKNTSYLVPHTVRSFENALDFHKKFWDYTPSGPTNILFNDFSDAGNGGTNVIPWNFLNIGVSPFDYTFSVIPSNERMQWLMSHELAHQVMCDKSSKADRNIHKFFGGKVMPDNRDPLSLFYSYITTPRWYSPRWYHEGIAVFMETWMSGGIGRVMGGYDEMIFRTMVRDSSFFYNVIGLETEGTTVDFQVGVNSYLYGTRFVSYLAYQYGMDKLKEFYSRTDTSRRFYASQFKEVYKTPVQKEWDNWIKWEKEFQKANMTTISKLPVTGYRKVVDKPLGSVSRPSFDRETGEVYVAVNYPGKLAHIECINLKTGARRTVAPVPTPGLFYVTSLAFDDSSKTLFASTHNSDWRGLQSIDARTGRVKNLIKYDRAGNLVFNRRDKCIYGVQSMSGRSTLIRITPPYKTWQDLYTLPFGRDLSDLDVSPDGLTLSGTLSNVEGKQKVVLIGITDLLAGKTGFSEIYEFEDNPAANFVFSPDGKYLYGTSYYTGVSNVFRIPLDTRQPEILTNATSGFFRPVPLSNDSMFLLEYSHEGMTPGIMKIDTLPDVKAIEYLGQKIYLKYPVVESWRLAPPSVVNLDSLHVTEKTYHPVKELKMAGAYPIIQGYKNYVAGGYRLNFMDPLGLNSLKVKIAISPYESLAAKQKLHFAMDYTYWNWTFSATYNYADFYDLFGPTKFSRAGYSFTAKYYKLFNRLSPTKTELNARISAYGDLETLPSYQNVASDFKNMYIGLVNFHKSYLRKSLGSIEPEQGYDWNAYAYSSLSASSSEIAFYPQLINNFDFGFLLPLRNSSLWFRTSAGQSFGASDKSNSKFYFGGFGNNYVDYRSAQQYREMESFPGLEINAISAMNYGKLITEIDLKPIRFRKFGFLGFYSTYARLSLFGMGMATNIDNGLPQQKDRTLTPRENFFAAGAQIDFEIVLFSLLKSTLSFGYSRAYGPISGNQYMVSLKL